MTWEILSDAEARSSMVYTINDEYVDIATLNIVILFTWFFFCHLFHNNNIIIFQFCLQVYCQNMACDVLELCLIATKIEGY
jgi:hypothetical protein